MFTIGGTDLRYRLSLYITARSWPTTISVSSQGVINYNYDSVITSPGELTLSLPIDFLLDDTPGLSEKVLKVTANSSITVNVYISSQLSNEGYLALPKSQFMNEYIVVTQTPTVQAQFAVIATENTTTINMTFPTSVQYLGQTYSSQDVLTIGLNQSQLFQFISSTSDLTGTWITSDKPIMLISGNKRKKFSNENDNNLIEQLPPLSTWGIQYVLNAVPTSDIFMFRIVAGYNNTRVYAQGKINTTLDFAGYTDVELNTNTQMLLQCSLPCLVVAYNRHGLKSSWMINQIPVKQFLNYYKVTVPILSGTSFAGDVHVYIQINSNHTDGLLFNQSPISLTWSSVNDSDISVAHYTIPSSYSSATFNHQDSTISFGLGVYAVDSSRGYGYPGGQSLSVICKPKGRPADGFDNDCDYRTDEELPNGIDDDGDGIIDEDLIKSPLQLYIPSNFTSRSCAPQNISKNPQTTGNASATDDSRCIMSPISYTDDTINSSCGIQIDRRWFVSDDCNTSVSQTQRIIIAYPLQEYLEPPNRTAICPEDLSPSSIGQPLVYDGQDCPGVTLPLPSITYQETRNQACQIVISRYWTLKPTFLCGYPESYFQQIYLGKSIVKLLSGQ